MSVVTATIISEGQTMPPEWHLLHLDICKEVNAIPWAVITLGDGNAALQEFPISDGDFFKPGAEVEIKLRYEKAKNSKDGADQTVFKGVAVKQTVKSGLSSSTLSVELKDKSFRLADQRKNALYEDQTDKQVIEKIIKQAGLTPKKIDSTKPKHAQLAQHYCGDWDFILSRSEANGLLLAVDDGEISAVKPDLSKRSALSLEYGGKDIKDIIYNLEMELDIRGQHGEVSAVCWDAGKHKISKPQKAKEFALKQGNLKPKDMASKISQNKSVLQSLVSQSPEEMKSWADAKMIKDRLSMLRGRLRIPGEAKVKPLNTLEIKKVGDRFSGKTIITGVRHQVGEKGWQTDIQFGLRADWFSSRTDIIDTPAAGLLPAINGLQTGVVQAFEKDKQGQFRIKAQIPALGEKAVVWARLAALDAGKKRGSFFIPEKGDEVVVGFFNDDPRQAVILGSLHSKKNPPPEPFKITAENADKGIVTREKLKILFNDKEKAIEISVPSGDKIVVKDGKAIEMERKNGDKLTMNDDGITVKTSKKLTLEGKEVIIKGSKVDVN